MNIIQRIFSWFSSSQRSSRYRPSGGYQVIVAYYPIHDTSYWPTPSCPGKLRVGDMDRQYPLLGQYNNTTDIDVIKFDFQAMKNAGVTVVNAHLFNDYDSNLSLMERIDSASRAVGISWTPTFESFSSNPHVNVRQVAAFLRHFAGSSGVFRDVDGNPAVFLRFDADDSVDPDANAKTVCDAIDLLRFEPFNVYLDASPFRKVARPDQTRNGDEPINGRFSDGDVTIHKQRVQGFYSWVSVDWALKPRGIEGPRGQVARNYIINSIDHGFRPVLSTTPSYNESNWGYQPSGNCGVDPADRTGQPRYNLDRNHDVWAFNLGDVLGFAPLGSWLYIQAYDEWGEGSTLAPNTYDGFHFLSQLKLSLHAKGWLSDSSPYVAPNLPHIIPPGTALATVALTASNGQFVCAEGGGGGAVVANRAARGPWETFWLVDLGGGVIALQASSGHFVCAEGGGGGAVVANRYPFGPWERFNLHDLGSNNIALQASNGQFVCAEGGGGGAVVANRAARGPWETFVLYRL